MTSPSDLDRLVALAAEVDESNSRLGIIRHEAMECVRAIPTLVARVRELTAQRDETLEKTLLWIEAKEAEVKLLRQRVTEAEATAETLRAQLHGMQDGAALRDALAAKERAEAKVGELEEEAKGRLNKVQTKHWLAMRERAESAEATLREAEERRGETVAMCTQLELELRHEREAREQAEAAAETLRAQLHGIQDGAALRDALAAKDGAEAERDAVVERCAQVAERYTSPETYTADEASKVIRVAHGIAANIRALKGKA